MSCKHMILCFAVGLLFLQACSLPQSQLEPPRSVQIPNTPVSSVGNPSVQGQSMSPVPVQAPISLCEAISSEDLAAYFTEYTNATMLLSDGVSQTIYNEMVSTQRYWPNSTFYIANALIALEEEIITIGDSVRLWDGTQYGRSDLNQNQDLASAMKYSCVWYQQQLAREIGKSAMQKQLNNIGYGNMDISGGIDRFWLVSSLLISPEEQLDFIIRLYHNELPFSQENMDYVKSIMKQENCPIDVYGKTGTSGEGRGWFIGYAIIKDKVYFFTTYIEGKNVGGPLARDKTVEILMRYLDR